MSSGIVDTLLSKDQQSVKTPSSTKGDLEDIEEQDEPSLSNGFSESLTSSTSSTSRHPLNCSICQGKFRVPKVLPCLHTFCEVCLIHYLPPESLTITCPQCGLQSILPEKGVPALQTNFCVSNLTMEKDNNGYNNYGTTSCSGCGGKVTFKCLQCDLIFCDSCAPKHPSGLKQGGSHEIAPFHLSLSEISNNGDQVVPDINQKSGFHTNGDSHNHNLSLESSLNDCRNNNERDELVSPNTAASRYLYCPSHAGQTLRFFCKDCDTAVCSSCTDIEHAPHVTVRAMDAVHDEKIRLGHLLKAARVKIDRLEEEVSHSEEMEKILTQRKLETVKDICESFDDLCTRLKGRKERLLQDLESTFHLKMDLIQKRKITISSDVEEMREYCQLTEKALSNENETEILFIKKQVGEKLESYASAAPEHASLSEEQKSSMSSSCLEFDRKTLENLKVEELGNVLSPLHTNWIFIGDGMESKCVKTSRRNVLKVQRTPPLPSEISLKEFKVETSSKDCVFSLEEGRDSSGSTPSRFFIIRFLVSRVGPFQLSLLLRNSHVQGSPLQFHAYEESTYKDESCSRSSIPSPASSCGRRSVTPRGQSTLYSYSTGGSRIPTRASLPCGSLSASSRVSTPTKYSHSHSNGNLSLRIRSVNGESSSRRSAALDDDLVVKIGRRGRGKGEFANPQGVAGLPGGGIVVTDSNNQCLQIFDNTGECKLRFGERGRRVGQLQRPVGIAVFPTNGNIAVADYDNRWISIFDPMGKFMNRIGHGKLLGPKGLTVDEKGLLYVVDNKGSAILVFQPNGKLVYKFGSRGNDEGQFAGPHFIAVNSKGNIIVTDFHNHCVKVFDCEYDYLFSFGRNGEGVGEFNAPTGIAVDKRDNIIVGDWGNSRLQIFDCQGSFLSFVSTSLDPLYGPQGLVVTSDEYIAVADSGNHCVKLYKYN